MFKPASIVTASMALRRLTVFCLALVTSSAGLRTLLRAEEPDPRAVREIFVPFEDLNVLLDAAPQRVFLTRAEYEQLLAQSQQSSATPPPANAVMLSAQYTIALEEGRSRISGDIEIDVLGTGLQAVELELEGVGVVAAQWQDTNESAALGRNPAGRAVLFVEGPARRRLRLELTAPLSTSAAQQTLSVQLPASPIARYSVSAPGNVQLMQGADVVTREVDESASRTQFALVAPPGPLSLVFSLNNRMQQRERLMLARSVVINEVAVGVERLHATISFNVLHGATDQLELAIPSDVEITDVISDQMTRWSTAPTDHGKKRLTIELRESLSQATTVTLAGVRLARDDKDWSFPAILPLNTAGHASVLGLLLEQGMRIEDVESENLVPINRDVLNQAFAAAALRREAAALPTRPVLAYYAPHAEYHLSAQFHKPPQQLEVVTNLVLQLSDARHEIAGVFSLSPKSEQLFMLHFRAPPSWQVTSVRDPSGSELPFERFLTDSGTRIQVPLPQAVAPGAVYAVEFSAVHIPTGWFDIWNEQHVTFPEFEVEDAAREIGAVSVVALDDLSVRPDILEQLSPLNDDERQQFGIEQQVDLAFRFDQRPFAATFHVQRTRPNMTARTLSFFRVDKSGLHAYYEIDFELREATTRRLQFALPASTAAELSIVGRGATVVKQFHSTMDGDRRIWDVLLAENVPLDQEHGGRATLAIRFQQPLPAEVRDYNLPLVEAEGVEYQTGFVAVEGDTELETRVHTDARKADVGEMVSAEYSIGRNLLGVYGYLGAPPPIAVSVSRRAQHPLPGAIVEHARLWTSVATSGKAQTTAQFELRTKALLLEAVLPKNAELWSVLVDGDPASPQRQGQVLLIHLVAVQDRPVRTVEITFGHATRSARLIGHVSAVPPQLRLPGEKGEPAVIVPLGELQWSLLLPKGYEISHSFGTVDPDILTYRPRHPFHLARVTYGKFFAGLGRTTSGGADYAVTAERAPSQHLTFEAPPAAAPADDSAMYEMPAEGGPSGDGLMGSGVQPEARPADPLIVANSPQFAPERAPGRLESTLPNVEATATIRGEPNGEEVDKVADLLGTRSLRMNVERAFQSAPPQQVFAFHSLGDEALLSVRILHRSKLYYFAWAVGLSIGLLGVLLTDRPWRVKIVYLGLVVALALMIPALTTWSVEFQDASGAAVLAASLLLPYYLFMAVVRLFMRLFFRAALALRRVVLLRTAMLLLVIAAPGIGRGQQEGEAISLQDAVQVMPPVKVPADAIIVPYDAESNIDPRHQDNRVLVPYDKYVELWNRAHPDKPLGSHAPPANHTVGAAQYEVTLEGDTDLTIRGTVELHSFSEEPTTVYLPFGGGVVVRASVDGQPARLQLLAATPEAAAPAQRPGMQPPPALLSVVITGRGRKVLALELRLKLDRQGGWRRAEGWLPIGRVGALAVTATEASTEIRLGGVADKTVWETSGAEEQIRSALLPDMPLVVQWRPKVAEGELDAALTAESTATLDVQEDRLQLAWQLGLQFRRGRRDEFQFLLPEGYLIEKVLGENVRGWDSDLINEQRQLRVMLLKPAADSERITLVLSKHWDLDRQQGMTFEAPMVRVEGASLQQGTLAVRRSVLLDVRTRNVRGFARTENDAAQSEALMQTTGAEERPLPVVPFQAFRFSHPDVLLQLEAHLLQSQVAVSTHAILRVSERRSALELEHVFHVEQAPVHRVHIELPSTFELEQISEPEYVVTDTDSARLVTIYLGAGRTGEFRIAIAGSLGSRTGDESVPLPRIRVRDVQRQDGQIAVQVDPAYQVRAESLENAEVIPLERVAGWLSEQQRELARQAPSLQWQSADYAGQLAFSRRTPLVRCTTLTNVHVTRRAIEETILLEFRIAEAGIQRLQFRLPERLAKARIQVPALRQKTLEMGVGSEDQPQMRVTLELQDELMDVIRVVIEHDQVLSSEPFSAPVPFVDTGEVTQQYVTLQNSSRDEVVIVERSGIDELASLQDQWRAIANLDVTQGYLVQRGRAEPRLVLRTQPRPALETVGARIGLSETVLVVDGHGAYRASQEFRVENSTEQYLELELPSDAQLWTAHVAGQAAKPVQPRRPGNPREIRIPIVKTETGDADYPVRIVYAGKLPPLDDMQRVRFPLARTVNIHVELSQVTLYLPRTHRWIDFRGAQKLTNRADYARGYENYFEEQVLRASRVITSGNSFDRSRAKHNLYELEKVLESNRSSYEQAFGDNSAIAAQNFANLTLIEETKQRLAEQEEAEVQQQLDNRAQLKEVWRGQRFRRSTNIAANTEDYFFLQDSGADDSKADDNIEQRFNERWFSQNQLGTADADSSGDGLSDVAADDSASMGKKAELLDLGAAIQQRRGAEILERKQAEPEPDMSMSQAGDATRDGRMGDVGRGGAVAMGSAGAFSMGRPADEKPGEEMRSAGGESQARTLYRSETTDGATNLFLNDQAPVAVAAPVTATGLSSLELTLSQRGTPYYFRATRGEVAITAAAVPQSHVSRLVRVACGLALVVAITWVLRRRR